MKKLLIEVILVAWASCVGAQTNKAFAHLWKATVTVLDETSQPVTGAAVAVSYYVQPPPGRPEAGEQIEGLTDVNGVFTASHSDTTIGLGFQATKHGYYPASKGYELGLPFGYDPVKWSPTLTLVLKKIGKPVAMNAKRVASGPPVFNKAVGYDLEAGDWTSPNGKGRNIDIIFTGELHQKARNDFDYKLTVSFPNKGDGIQAFHTTPADEASAFRSSREAPQGGYVTADCTNHEPSSWPTNK